MSQTRLKDVLEPENPSERTEVTRIVIPPLLTIVGLTAVLYLGRDILMPMAVAILLTFALAPIVSFLRRRGVPKIIAVVFTVLMAFVALLVFGFLVASQISNLAQNIPTYQNNIIEKVRSLQEMGASGGVIERLTGAIERVGKELQAGTQSAVPEQKPLPVEVVTSQSPLDILFNIVVPLVSPFATAGLIVVVVIFMLVEREQLRDRFIRLVGAGDLHRTTEALQDAGKRVGRYLLMQLVINTTYAIPIALGLWLLGLPNALLWGLLTLVLRFVPYIGPAIGMILPMLLTVAATPGWAPLIWTAALFIVMELVSNNIMEPWLYGTRTGLSPLAVIVSAIFWAWLWGPLGLVLSTPLTVCLVVLGRHVRQFEFLDVMFGNEPVLEPPARVYQRLLAGDPDEAVDYAEQFLREAYLIDFYDKVGVPALLLGELDRARGVMTDSTRKQFATAALTMIGELEDIADEEEEENGENGNDKGSDPDDDDTPDLPDGEGRALLCIGGRGEIDDALAAMTGQVMAVQGATAGRLTHSVLEPKALGAVDLDGIDTVVLAYLNASSAAYARQAVRRLKRRKAKLRIGLLVPTLEGDRGAFTEDKTNADFVVTTIAQAVIRGFADDKPVPLKRGGARLSRRRPAKKLAKQDAA